MHDASDYGNLYELYYNYGILDAIDTYICNGHAYCTNYQRIYETYIPGFKENDRKQVLMFANQDSPLKIHEFCMGAYMSGKSFIRAAISSICGKASQGIFQNEDELHYNGMKLNIVYLQLGLHHFLCQQTSPAVLEAKQSVFENSFPFKLTNENMIQETEKGRFLNADTMMLFKYKDTLYLYVTDESLKARDCMLSVNSANELSSYLKTILMQTRMASVLKYTSIEKAYDGLEMNKALHSSMDKEMLKTVQAASYAYSFIRLLQEKSEQKGKRMEFAHVSCLGVTNTGVSTLHFQNPGFEEMFPFYEAYVNKTGHSDYQEKLREKEKKLKKNVSRHYTEEPPEDNWNVYSTILTGYAVENNALREKHAQMVAKYLDDTNIKEVILCAMPGIGKTTAVLNYYEDKKVIGGYNPPRTCINEDFLQKTRKMAKTIALTRNSKMANKIICYQADNEVSEYVQNITQGTGYQFMETNMNAMEESMYLISQKTRNQSVVTSNKTSDAVLKQMAESTGLLINCIINDDSEKVHRIFPVLTTQALGSCKSSNFSDYISKIFQCANDRNFQKHFDSIVWMVDEIAGDTNGIKVTNWLRKGLKNITSTNTKLIIADASITNQDTYRAYKTGSEAETIYIADGSLADSVTTQIIGKNKDVVIINCNGYPARQLYITYKVAASENRNQELISKLYKDICKWMQTRKTIQTSAGQRKEQCLAFIQNKTELLNLKQRLSQAGIESYTITSWGGLTREEEEEINTERAKPVILITSSASRGLSFKYVTTFLMCVPTFQIPSNTAELIQTIYRGRGDTVVDENESKHLIFYINLPCTRSDDEVQRQTKHTINQIDAYTIMSFLHSCIETRIFGYDRTYKKAVTPLGKQGLEDRRHEDSYFFELARIRDNLSTHKNDIIAQIYNNIPVENATTTKLHGWNRIRNLLTHETQSLMKQKKNQEEIQYFTVNGMLIFKVQPSDVLQEHDYTRLISIFDNNSLEDILACTTERKEQDAIRDLNNLIQVLRPLSHSTQVVKDIPTGYYLAIPQLALNAEFTREEWNALSDEDDVVMLMRGILSSIASVDTYLPINGRIPFENVPYILFTSSDIEQKIKERYFSTKMITETSTNVLSLMFSE